MLSVQNLSITFKRHEKDFSSGSEVNTVVVKNLSFDISPLSVLGIVGESGSGKSVTVHAILGLLPSYGFQPTGSVFWEGEEIFHANASNIKKKSFFIQNSWKRDWNYDGS